MIISFIENGINAALIAGVLSFGGAPRPAETNPVTVYELTTSPAMDPSDFPTEVSVQTPEPTHLEALYPAQILDLDNWKLTLSIGSYENPTEILQPQLSTFQLDPLFIALPDEGGVRFRAPVTGVTTEGSDYTRTELREMTEDGEKASWDSASGRHTMFIDQAITAVPQGKQHIVAGQIHDDEDDVIVIRLEEEELFIDADGDTVAVLDEHYQLGTRFSVKFVVENGMTSVYYNGSETPSYVLEEKYSRAYFKAGAYTQSNCEKEGEKGTPCSDDNYGQVIIYGLSVSHSEITGA